MPGLKAGFARVDFTPNIGYPIDGYYEKRYTDGFLDNLYATAVAFDDGEKKAVLISLDAIGMSQNVCDQVRKLVAEKIGTEPEGVYITCTHTHLGLGFAVGGANLYKEEAEIQAKKITFETSILKICDAAILAVNDLKAAKLSYTTGEVENVSFIRRYRMQDGSIRTNPNKYGAFAVEPLGEADKTVQHLIIEREGGHNIGIVNFQVHPDVIGGCKISADYPHFVRDTYEKLVPDSRCMYINGAQGDSNHIDVRLEEGHPMKTSYKRAEYMGRKIAMAAVNEYEFAIPLEGDKISFGQKNIMVKHNKGNKEETEFALKMKKIYNEADVNAAVAFVSKEKGLPMKGENPWIEPARAEMRRLNRIAGLADMPDEKELYLTAIAIGDVVFAGFPGEPFTEIGRQVKKNSKFTLTIPSCCSNGYEGYFPMASAFAEKGYEADTARYVCGTAEKLIETSLELIETL